MNSQLLNAKELQALISVSKTVNAHIDLDTVLESIMTVTTDVMRVEASSLAFIDELTDELVFHITQGEKAEKVKPIRIKKGDGIIGLVAESGKPIIVNDVNKDPRFYKKVDEKSGFRTRSILCVPLMTSKRIWGAIEVLNKTDNTDFDEHDMVLCEAIACQAAIAVENAMLHKHVVKTERMAAIGRTIAGLAHCIKNVLNGVQGGSYMIDLGLNKDDPSKIIKGWDIVKKNNHFMQQLVLDMLTYSKEREPEYKVSDLGLIIESVCTLMSTKAEEKSVKVKWTSDPSLNAVILDPKGIQRCMLNLISNAVDACADKKDGEVEVTAEICDEKNLCIKIRDNGHGISENDLKKIFQVFFSTKGSKGTGLGLAVTHKIITEHKGRMDVESESEKGTLFTITLPLHKDKNFSVQSKKEIIHAMC